MASSKTLFQHLAGRTEKIHENYQDKRCACRKSIPGFTNTKQNSQLLRDMFKKGSFSGGGGGGTLRGCVSCFV
jgi:hypothetical protein